MPPKESKASTSKAFAGEDNYLVKNRKKLLFITLTVFTFKPAYIPKESFRCKPQTLHLIQVPSFQFIQFPFLDYPNLRKT